MKGTVPSFNPRRWQHAVKFRTKVRRCEKLAFSQFDDFNSRLYPRVSESQAPKFTLYVMTKQNDKSKRKARALSASAQPSIYFKVRSVWKT